MGFPKPLLEYQGETFLDRLIGLLAGRCAPVIAVLGAHAAAVRAGLRRGGEAVLIENPEFPLGQFSSMQCGLRAVPEGAAGVLFTLADHPGVSAETIEALLDPPSGSEAAPFRIPRHGGKRGHPIWIAASILPEFLALPPTATAKEVVTRHAGQIAYIDVQDPGILLDVDDRAAYARLVEGGI